LGQDAVGDCLSGAVKYSDIPEAWWLATTSRWRTTPALHQSPTKPVPCSRIREHLENVWTHAIPATFHQFSSYSRYPAEKVITSIFQS
jgi:hypothetical protein